MNNGIVPLAIVLCKTENKDAWGWFLSLLRDFVDDRRQMTFMCDK